MKIIIAGGTGFIGKALTNDLAKEHNVIVITRDPAKAKRTLPESVDTAQWDPRSLTNAIDGSNAVINLAGENIATGRWTTAKKERILKSRIDSTTAIALAINESKSKPQTLIQASAIGFYGPNPSEELNEYSPQGKGFLAETCSKWEETLLELNATNLRTIIIRTAVVLGPNGGALKKMILPFRFFLGGWMGKGDQWISWITIDDQIKAIKFLLQNEHLKGVFNLSAPNPITAKQFAKTIGKVLNKPAWLPVPAIAAKIALGQMAQDMLLEGQKVIPQKLLEAGFEFKYPQAKSALEHILKPDQS